MTLTLKIIEFGVQQSEWSILPKWPWPSFNNLGTRTWPRYGQDVLPYQKWSFYVKAFKSYSMYRHTHTDTHTHRVWKHYLPAYAGDKNVHKIQNYTTDQHTRQQITLMCDSQSSCASNFPNYQRYKVHKAERPVNINEAALGHSGGS